MKQVRLTALPIMMIVFTIGICFSCNTKVDKGVDAAIISNPMSADGVKKDAKLPVAQFNKVEHNFGIILQGEKVAYTFKVKNIGASNLIINNAKASCGCTVPRFSQEPIAPGSEGEIEVIFSSEGRTGNQLKTVTIWTNCQPNTHKLTIISEIIVPNK